MGKRPVIGLNMSCAASPGEDHWELQAPLTYVDAVLGADGLPVFLPPDGPPGGAVALIRQMASLLDGIIFIGGEDYWPVHYGGHPQPAGDLVPEYRDRFDLALATWIIEETVLPVLGICGGAQLIALALGGALVQDIRTEWHPRDGGYLLPHAKGERPEARPEDFRHPVTIEAGSLLDGIMAVPPGDRLETNSFHHQSVHPDRPGRHLTVSAWADDGIAEAIEPAPDSPWAVSGRFLLGVQWHPERMLHEEPQRHLFHALVAAAGRRRRCR